MALTILLAIMMMVGLFLMLLSGVGFIQDKRFFTSGPRRCCSRNTGRLWICSVLHTLFNNASFIKSLRYLVL